MIDPNLVIGFCVGALVALGVGVVLLIRYARGWRWPG